MARIAVGGFHHETNCFVEPPTDFEYFAAHRDRPPLVRGPEVVDPTKYPYKRLRPGVRRYPLGPQFTGAAPR